jgi:hypothetical protein
MLVKRESLSRQFHHRMTDTEATRKDAKANKAHFTLGLRATESLGAESCN